MKTHIELGYDKGRAGRQETNDFQTSTSLQALRRESKKSGKGVETPLDSQADGCHRRVCVHGTSFSERGGAFSDPVSCRHNQAAAKERGRRQ